LLSTSAARALILDALWRDQLDHTCSRPELRSVQFTAAANDDSLQLPGDATSAGWRGQIAGGVAERCTCRNRENSSG
jgi:hypothetical protein